MNEFEVFILTTISRSFVITCRDNYFKGRIIAKPRVIFHDGNEGSIDTAEPKLNSTCFVNDWSSNTAKQKTCATQIDFRTLE